MEIKFPIYTIMNVHESQKTTRFDCRNLKFHQEYGGLCTLGFMPYSNLQITDYSDAQLVWYLYTGIGMNL